METLIGEVKQEYDSARTCPHLGIREDSETCYAYACNGHLCYGVKPPESIQIEHQEKYCLSPNYEKCAIFQEEWKGSLPLDISLKKAVKPRVWRYVLGVLTVVVLTGIFWVFWGSDALAIAGKITPITFDVLPLDTQVAQTIPKRETPTHTATDMDTAVAASENLVPPPASATATLPQSTPTPTIHPTWTTQPTMTFTPPPTPGPGLGTPFGAEQIYVLFRVQEGQSLLGLAQLYDTSPEAIHAANVLRTGRTVWPGDIIVIPVGESDPGKVIQFVYQFIEKKTNIQELVAETNVSADDLRKYNQLGADEWIPAGRWLIIPAAGP